MSEENGNGAAPKRPRVVSIVESVECHFTKDELITKSTEMARAVAEITVELPEEQAVAAHV